MMRRCIALILALAVCMGIFSACIKLAENKIPVICALSFVIAERYAASAVFNLKRMVKICRYCYDISVSFACLIDSV